MRTLLLLAATILSLLAGAFYGNRAKCHPELFWPYLIIGLVFTTPLMVGGYTWYDEFFAGGFLLANLFRNIKVSAKASHKIFILFCIYMLFQSFRGIVFFSRYGLVEAITKSRWIFFFIIVLFLFAESASAKINNVFDKDLPYKVTKAGLIFNLIYLSVGLIAIYTTGHIYFSQNAMISDVYRVGTSPLVATFGATGYVVSVYLVFIPAALITIRNDVAGRRNIGWLTMALSLATQVLYNSRSGILMIIIFISLFVFQYGFKLRRRIFRGLLLFIPMLGLLLIFQGFFNEVRIEIIYKDLLNTLHLSDTASYDPNLQDIDRKVWNKSAIVALSDNVLNFSFGWGLRTSGYIVAPHVYDLFMGARGSATLSEDVSTPGFSALAVDIGVIGMFFIAAILMCCLAKIYRKTRRSDLFLLFAPVAFILQLFVMNIFDVLLLYLSIMPCGLYVVLAKCNLRPSSVSSSKINRSQVR